MEQIRRATDEIITKIRTHTDDLENKRRIQEEKMRKERANKIQTEVITSHKKNVEIDWTWQELEEKFLVHARPVSYRSPRELKSARGAHE